MAEVLSPKLLKVMERAKRDPETRFLSLAHLLDEEALAHAFRSLRKDAAVGVDGITHASYGDALAPNLRDLHERLRSKRYRHQVIRRVHIPKDKGKTRPIGISSVEDKVVQGALRDVLEAVYEPVFRDCSYGFRRGRSAHDAMRSLDRVLHQGKGSWVLEADIQTFFDSIDRTMLMTMLREKIADESFLRLVGKCLHVGVLDGDEFSEPEEGTAQGSVLSPLLGNVYLHHVLDLWFEQDVLPRMRGAAHLVRYADDFVICFEREDDARRVMAVIGARFAKHGLTLHPDKTRLIYFERPSKRQQGGKGPDTFDFLGFTIHWRQSLSGTWVPGMKTRTGRVSRIIKVLSDLCRRQRHRPVQAQHQALARRLRGHFNYFGVNGNMRSMHVVAAHAERLWFKWLNRRSQRRSKNWVEFRSLLQRLPLPTPKIHVQIWSP